MLSTAGSKLRNLYFCLIVSAAMSLPSTVSWVIAVRVVLNEIIKECAIQSVFKPFKCYSGNAVM